MFLLASTTHVQGRGFYILTRAEVRTKHHGGEEMLLTTARQDAKGRKGFTWMFCNGLLYLPQPIMEINTKQEPGLEIASFIHVTPLH